MKQPEPNKQQLEAFETYMRAVRTCTYAQMMCGLYLASPVPYPDAHVHAAGVVLAQATDDADRTYLLFLQTLMPNVG